ncbi:EF-hand [Neoconidiobolus thromboides FSU 785]|nr:EF-hand [Neoconidiobolus thromboides FSU 785]
MTSNNLLIYGLNSKQFEQAKDLFDLYDTDRDGKISVEELKALIRYYVTDLSMDVIKSGFKKNGMERNDTIDFDGFLNIAKQLIASKIQLEQARELFDLYDTDKDGKIVADELVDLMQRYVTEVDIDEINIVYKDTGMDGKDYIDLERFLKVAKQLFFPGKTN